MEIKQAATCGTLESSDAMVSIAPSDEGLLIDIQSSVINQYGKDILETAKKVLNRLDIKKAQVSINDRGALSCTIKARIECCAYRANGSEDYDWGGAINE